MKIVTGAERGLKSSGTAYIGNETAKTDREERKEMEKTARPTNTACIGGRATLQGASSGRLEVT